MSKIYIYSLVSEKELPELSDIGKKWKDVGIISLFIKDIDDVKPEVLQKLGEDIANKLIKYKQK